MVLSLSSSTTLKSTAALTLFLLGATTTSTTTFATAAANNNSSSSSFALSPSPFKQQRSSTFLTSSTSPSTTTTSSNRFNNNQVTKMPTKTSKIMATSSSSSPSSTKDVKQTHTKEEQKNLKVWNRFATNYAKSPIADEDAYQHKLQLTRKYMDKDTTNALEFGCGTGGTALLHSPYVKHYHATDVSSTMIGLCKEKQKESGNGNVDNVSFECIGIDSLAAAKAKTTDADGYDMVLGLSILHLLPQKDQTICDVHSMLKPGGYFVSSTTCLKEISGFKFISPILKLGGYFGLLPTLNPFSKDELIQSIEKNGELFDIKELYHPGPDKAVFIIAQKK